MKPKLLIIGYAQHGKDTVCELLRDEYGYKFMSSSMFVAEEVIFEQWGKDKYPSVQAMYEDRHDHRALWFNMIREYNKDDDTRTARAMLERGYDIYCGMRSRAEYAACREAGLFDYVLWVDAMDRLPREPTSSMELLPTDADFLIDNNCTVEHLQTDIHYLFSDPYGPGIDMYKYEA